MTIQVGRRFSAALWLFQAVSGIILLVLVALHVLITHPQLDQQLFDIVASRLKDPVWAAYYLAFLGLLTFHGFNGVRAVLLDINLGRTYAKTVSAILIIAGAALFLYGASVIITVGLST